MAPGQNLSSAAYRAADQARRLEHGWIGPEHVLLALFAEPSPATEALEEVGVTRDQAEEAARAMGRSDPPPPPYDPGAGLSPNSAWYRLTGCAEGLGLAAGRRWPRPEHFLVAMVYGDHVLAPLLRRAGTSEQALLAALARRGVPVPEADPPAYRPWRGGRHVEVTEAELQPVVGLLIDGTRRARSGAGASTGCPDRRRAGRGGPLWTPRRASTSRPSWKRSGRSPAP